MYILSALFRWRCADVETQVFKNWSWHFRAPEGSSRGSVVKKRAVGVFFNAETLYDATGCCERPVLGASGAGPGVG